MKLSLALAAGSVMVSAPAICSLMLLGFGMVAGAARYRRSGTTVYA